MVFERRNRCSTYAGQPYKSRSRACCVRSAVLISSVATPFPCHVHATETPPNVQVGGSAASQSITGISADRSGTRSCHDPWHCPILFVWKVPSAQGRFGFSCENTPIELSHPGATHACTIQPATISSPSSVTRASRRRGRHLRSTSQIMLVVTGARIVRVSHETALTTQCARRADRASGPTTNPVRMRHRDAEPAPRRGPGHRFVSHAVTNA